MAPVDDELHARLDAWADVRPLSEAGALSAASINALRDSGLRLFYGGRGIWTDKRARIGDRVRMNRAERAKRHFEVPNRRGERSY